MCAAVVTQTPHSGRHVHKQNSPQPLPKARLGAQVGTPKELTVAQEPSQCELHRSSSPCGMSSGATCTGLALVREQVPWMRRLVRQVVFLEPFQAMWAADADDDVVVADPAPAVIVGSGGTPLQHILPPTLAGVGPFAWFGSIRRIMPSPPV